MYDFVIKNGKVVLPTGVTKCDIAVKDEKIVAIGKKLDAKEIIDAEGLIVTPGMIDAHVHISEPGRVEWEGYETGSKSAAKGGVTTCIEMPLNQLPCTTDKAALQMKLDASKNKLMVDFASLGALTPNNLDALQELSEAGVVGYKAFMSTCGDRSLTNDMQNVDDYSLYEGMRRIEKTKKPLLLHCENALITDRLGEIAKANQADTLAEYVATRPVFTEVEAIRRAIYIAKQTNVKLHICHISCYEGVLEVLKAKAEGMDITCETCTHYLYFSTDELDAIGNTTKCSPPIRDKENQNKLWEQLMRGDIQFVTSDHSPCTPDLKEGNPFSAWGGISALQSSYIVFFDEAVQKRKMCMVDFVNLTATNVAKRFNLKEKGSIGVGMDADFAFIKENSPQVLQKEDLEYKNKISPYVGKTIRAEIIRTMVRGKTVYEKEKGFADQAEGKFLCETQKPKVYA